MARFYGNIGFAINEEVRPGIYKEIYEEFPYKGDVLRNTRRWEATEHLNDDISISNDISIIADTFAKEHFGVMRYVHWMKQYFEIVSATIDTERHRITLSLGGIFNVPDPD
jgi:hypothetical protein